VGAAPGDRQQKDIKLDVSRAKYWLGVGAQPSDTVWRLLAMVRLNIQFAAGMLARVYVGNSLTRH
jgi:ribosomal protein S16